MLFPESVGPTTYELQECMYLRENGGISWCFDPALPDQQTRSAAPDGLEFESDHLIALAAGPAHHDAWWRSRAIPCLISLLA